MLFLKWAGDSSFLTRNVVLLRHAKRYNKLRCNYERVTYLFYQYLGILFSQLETKHHNKPILCLAACIESIFLLEGKMLFHQRKYFLENIMMNTRAQLTQNRKHHPKSGKERVFLNRKKGGRGLLDWHYLCNRQLESLRSYFINQDHTILKDLVQADKNLTCLNLPLKDFTGLQCDTSEQKTKFGNLKLAMDATWNICVRIKSPKNCQFANSCEVIKYSKKRTVSSFQD